MARLGCRAATSGKIPACHPAQMTRPGHGSRITDEWILGHYIMSSALLQRSRVLLLSNDSCHPCGSALHSEHGTHFPRSIPRQVLSHPTRPTIGGRACVRPSGLSPSANQRAARPGAPGVPRRLSDGQSQSTESRYPGVPRNG